MHPTCSLQNWIEEQHFLAISPCGFISLLAYGTVPLKTDQMFLTKGLPTIWHCSISKYLQRGNGSLIFFKGQLCRVMMKNLTKSTLYPENGLLNLDCVISFLFHNYIFPLGFLPLEFRLLSLWKASCYRVKLPKLQCMLGVLVFPIA